MNFVAMDFETANRTSESACSLALVMVRDNKVVDEYYTLINPEVPFDPGNIRIHGIHPADIKDAPTFPQIWPDFKDLFQPNTLVAAHNASFDNRVLKSMLTKYDILTPNFLSIDTLKTSRRLHPELPNHRLNTVSKALGIDLEHHHHALADSLACAKILIEEDEQFGDDAIKRMVRLIN